MHQPPTVLGGVALLAIGCTVLANTGNSGGLYVTSLTLVAAGLASIFLSIVVLLFMRPRFLVPPYLRGRSGFVRSAWRDHFVDRQK